MRVLLFLLISFSIFSQDISILFVNNYPYCYEDNNNVVKGIDVEIIQTILGSMGYNVNFIRKNTYIECYIDLKNNIGDIVLNIEKNKYVNNNNIPLSYKEYAYYKLKNSNNNRFIITNNFSDFLDKKANILKLNKILATYYSNKFGIELEEVNYFQEKKVNYYIGYVSQKGKIFSDKIDYNLKNFKGSIIYKNIISKYTDIEMWKKITENSNFFYGLIIVFIIFLILFFVYYETIKYNHLNLKSLMNLIAGSVVIVIADVFPITQEYTIYFKILGILFVSFGIYNIYLKYHNKKVVTVLYFLYVIIISGLMFVYFHISVFYNLLTLLAISLLIQNIIKFGIRNHILINVSCVFYIIYMLLITLGRANIIEFTNAYAFVLLSGFIFQLLSSVYDGYDIKNTN